MVLFTLAEFAFEGSLWTLKQSYNICYYMLYGESETKEDKILKNIEEIKFQGKMEREELEKIKKQNKMMKKIYKQMIERGEIISINNLNKRNSLFDNKNDAESSAESSAESEEESEEEPVNLFEDDAEEEDNSEEESEEEPVNLFDDNDEKEYEDSDEDSDVAVNLFDDNDEKEYEDSGEVVNLFDDDEEVVNKIKTTNDEFIYSYYKNILTN